ncbi:glycosyltransferase family 2 protein [candidate division KSB1 bacterium]
MNEKKRQKVVVVMPAYNAELTVEKTYRDIPEDTVDDVILVDDASTDNTVETAKKIGIFIHEHKKNLGYGGNQKTCYKLALERGADIVIMIHPDYQYDSTLIPFLIEPIKKGLYDVMLGSRIRTRAETLAGGMPFYKYISNRLLTIIENIALGQNLSEFHTGFRVFSRKVLETLPLELNSDDFVFDTQMLVQSVAMNFRIGEFPVPVRYFKEASSINFRRSAIYGLGTLVTVAKYLLHKTKIIKFKCFQPKK